MTNKFEYTTATDEDIEGIYDLLKSVEMHYDLNVTILKRMLKISGDLMLVARTNEQVIGVLIAAFNGDSVMLSHLAVIPDFQNSGVGSALEKILEERAKKIGARQILVDAKIDAGRFYRKKGFRLPGSIFMLKKL